MRIVICCLCIAAGLLAGACTPPPPLPFKVVATEVDYAENARISSYHVRGDYAREQGVDRVFIPVTEEVDQEALDNNARFDELARSDDAHAFMMTRVLEGLQSEFAEQAAERGQEGRAVNLEIRVLLYDYNLGNQGVAAAVARGTFGVNVPPVAQSDRMSQMRATVRAVDAATGEVVVPELVARGRVHKVGLRVPGFEAVNRVMVRHLLKDYSGYIPSGS